MPKERLMDIPMALSCNICGNKYCPHATDHELDCSNSNEQGQDGSFFTGKSFYE
jgi:hypothetical protein